MAQDVGRAINPLSIEGQIQGAVTQGIGWALMEDYIFEKGVVQNDTLLDYRMPTATDVPMIDVMIVESYGLEGLEDPRLILFRIYTGEAYFWTMEYNLRESDIEKITF